MTTLTLELPTSVYERLKAEATHVGKPVETLVEEWLIERVPPPAPPGERERAIAVLRAAGLLTELGPEARKLAESSTATLEEVQAIFARVGGQPLSETVLEMRGPKE